MHSHNTLVISIFTSILLHIACWTVIDIKTEIKRNITSNTSTIAIEILEQLDATKQKTVQEKKTSPVKKKKPKKSVKQTFNIPPVSAKQNVAKDVDTQNIKKKSVDEQSSNLNALLKLRVNEHSKRALQPSSVALNFWKSQALTSSSKQKNNNNTNDKDHSFLVSKRLSEHAKNKSYLTQKPKIKLERRSDGSYEYKGNYLHAVISPQGEITYNNKNVSAKYDKTTGKLNIGFDLNNIMEQLAGNNPLLAEQLRFLQETKPFRKKLIDQHKKALQKKKKSSMRIQLQKIWDHEKLSIKQKKKEIFLLWDNLYTNEARESMRREIMIFIQKRMALSSPFSFSPQELSKLNKDRKSKSVFAPYDVLLDNKSIR